MRVSEHQRLSSGTSTLGLDVGTHKTKQVAHPHLINVPNMAKRTYSGSVSFSRPRAFPKCSSSQYLTLHGGYHDERGALVHDESRQGYPNNEKHVNPQSFQQPSSIPGRGPPKPQTANPELWPEPPKRKAKSGGHS